APCRRHPSASRQGAGATRAEADRPAAESADQRSHRARAAPRIPARAGREAPRPLYKGTRSGALRRECRLLAGGGRASAALANPKESLMADMDEPFTWDKLAMGAVNLGAAIYQGQLVKRQMRQASRAGASDFPQLGMGLAATGPQRSFGMPYAFP